MRALAVLALLMAVALVCDVSAASTLYRCGPVGNSYSQIPCPDGQRMEVDDSRTAEQHMQARLLATQTRDQALALERDRLDKEAAFRAPRAGSLSSPATAQFSATPVHAKARRVKKKRSARTLTAAPHMLRTEPAHAAHSGAQ